MIELLVDGKVLTGWKTASVQRTIEAAAGGFLLQVSERIPWPMSPGDPCSINIDGERVLTGYIDSIDARIEGDQHEITIMGRDKTADLVDCSAMNDPGEWLSLRAHEIAADLASPFGIFVLTEETDQFLALNPASAAASAEVLATEPFDTFKLQPGESAWGAIERACRLRGLLGFADGFGNLVISRPRKDRLQVDLIEGENVLRAKAAKKLADRFSEYHVRGQSPTTDEFSGESANEVEGTARDLGVGRYRPLIILAESSVDNQSAAIRAGWENTFRAARSSPLTVTTQGHRQSETGLLWRPNRRVVCYIPSVGVFSEMLIASARYDQSERGTTTVMKLALPDSFTPQPVVEDKAGPLGLGWDEFR